MSPKPTKPCDLYIRVSRVNGRSGDSFISPELQETQARGMAAARGIAVGRVITDLDQSGGKMDRPGLNKALARIRARESGGIIVARLDRFARTLVGALDTLAEIEQAGGVVVAADGEFDTSTSNGRFMRDFMLRLHQYYREQVAERWVDSQTAARARGVHITARVPFGYKRNGNGTLAQSEDAALVKEIFTRRARGESWQTICDWLDLQGARTPMLGEGKGVTGGGNRWTESSLRKLVQNPLYKGDPRGGDEMPEAARSSLKIVSARVWAKAQPANGGRRPRSEEGAMLGGLVYCGVCGRLMTPELVTKRGKKTQVYRCRQRAADAKPCPAPMTVSGNLLEPFVAEQALARLWAAGEFQTERHTEDGLDTLREAVADARHDLHEFEQAAAAEGMTPAQVAKHAARFERVLTDAQTALAEAQSRAEVEVEFFTESDGRSAFEKAPIPKQRALMHEVLRGITVKRGAEPIAERTKMDWRQIHCSSCGALIEGTRVCSCGGGEVPRLS